MVRRFTRRNFLNLAAMAAAAPLFEVKALRGVDFVLQNSPTARKFLIETMPGLSISLHGTRSNRDGYGARVSVNGQTRFATTAGSYVCANDRRLHFGLGSAEKATVEIHWPSGVKQVLNDVRSDQFLEVREPER